MADELEIKLEESGGFFLEGMRKTTKNPVKIMHPYDIRSWYLRNVTQKACPLERSFWVAHTSCF
jgi:hypothetical protein